MSSSALNSQGMVLQILKSDSPNSPLSPSNHYVTIPEITEINGPDGTAAFIETTDLSSTAKSRRPGLQDNGNITASMMFVPNNPIHDLLWSHKASTTLGSYQLVFTDSPRTIWRFQAYVAGIPITNSVDDVTRAQMTLSIDGSITVV